MTEEMRIMRGVNAPPISLDRAHVPAAAGLPLAAVNVRSAETARHAQGISS